MKTIGRILLSLYFASPVTTQSAKRGLDIPKKRNAKERLMNAGMAIALTASFLLVTTPAGAVETLPILWEAGGLSAGTDSAGQAARVAADTAGNVAVVSGPSEGLDLAVTSYTATGVFRWKNAVSPSIATFIGDWVAAAPNGDFVAVGRNINSSGNPIAITLVRFGSDGTLQWRVDLARTLPSVGRLLVDSGGNAYLVFNSVGDGQDIQLHKYNPSGTLLWSQVITTGFFANNIATSLALSADETDVVVTGDTSGGAEWITALYDTSTGARQWLVTAPEGTAALDVVIDTDQVYVTGLGNIGITGFLTVVAYDRATGARLWRTDKKPADGAIAVGLRMDLAPDGSVVVTGQASRGFLDWYTVAFETTGVVRWEAVRDGGLNTDEIPAAVLVLPDGTTVVTGKGGPNLPGGFIPGVTAGYSSAGSLLWEAFSPLATVWVIALPNGDVVATGGYDAYLAAFRPSGAPSPSPSPSPGISPSPSPSPSPGISPSPSPSPSPGISPSPSPTPSPGISPSPSPSPSPGISPSPSPSPSPGISPSPSPSPGSQAINLSTRMRVQTGDNVGIGGFIITGSTPKHILLRAIGPSLTGSGVPDALADPVLELHGPGAFATITNNNWRQTQETEIQATGIPPSNDFESAIDATLAPGAYTAIVRGNGNTAGVALAEVYDLNQGVASKLANISTRAFISTGDNIVIAGFMLGGSSAADRIVVRGIGPSLTAVGVPNALEDPRLDLRDTNGALLAANNDWQENPAQAAELTAAGLAPSNPLESGIAMTLPPGAYTVLVAGLNNGTGNGVVEVYDCGAP